MNILVVLAGVADNRYPLHQVALDSEGNLHETGQTRRILGPFDEGALELALKLRDKSDAISVHVLVLGGANEEQLARSVAAFKPDSLRILHLRPCRPWDSSMTAAQIGAFVRDDETQPDLVFIGREFGDLDEGSIPVMLATELQLPLFSLAQYAEWQGDQVRLMREKGTRREWLSCSGTYLATVTNDRRNKLRHPLMKNVMMAKRLSIETVTQNTDEPGSVRSRELAEPRAAKRQGQCRMIDGSVQEQAAAIVDYLRKAAG
ncbi:electron transfer flavoprotein subunit beta [Marinobacter pelagius]|uniref:electron transfer flavoprotein subunit beta/FixA family protein n=1 Tax=Marinobacter sp. C7 TaxID=2951363 RepID=UPI001EF02F23|nr:electron transfer flavoprotein subunit beta [Marinobacter sp. C7]MCG7200270.1 electron transfer flavoprotein subunit beta [Marinobacter sp. C7]